MPTLTQIARSTGLSTSTVSRVLRGHQDVSEQTRQQVQQALGRSGYAPAGRPVRRGRPPKAGQAIKLGVICGHHARIRRDPFFAPILTAALDAGAPLGARAEPLDWPDSRTRPPAALERIRGAVCIACPPRHLPYLAARMPVVTVDSYHPGSGADGVVADYRRGAFECVRHLLAKGHRRIALLSATRGEADHFSNLLYDGARRALELAGVEPWAHFVAGYVITPEDGYALTRELLNSPEDERPTALFGSDHAMLGALRAAHDLGVKVPEELAVVGVDDIELGRYAVPRLSTVRVDKEAMARAALERVLWRLRHPESVPCRIVMDCRFIERDSS